MAEINSLSSFARAISAKDCECYLKKLHFDFHILVLSMSGLTTLTNGHWMPMNMLSVVMHRMGNNMT